MEDFTSLSSTLSAEGKEFVPSSQTSNANGNLGSIAIPFSQSLHLSHSEANFSELLPNFANTDSFQFTGPTENGSGSLFSRLSTGIDSSSEGSSIFASNAGLSFLHGDSVGATSGRLGRIENTSVGTLFADQTLPNSISDGRCQFCGVVIRNTFLSSQFCDACELLRQQRQIMQGGGRQEPSSVSVYEDMQYARTVRDMSQQYVSSGSLRGSPGQSYSSGQYAAYGVQQGIAGGFNPRANLKPYPMQPGYSQNPRPMGRPPMYNQPRPLIRSGRDMPGGYPMYNMPASPKMAGPPCTLYFGGVLKKDSLVGGCAWWIADQYHETIAHGSDPVQQASQSLIRLEYEGLLNGLKAAFLKNIRVIQIKGSSHMVISHFKNRDVKFPFFQTVYYLVEDLSSAIANVLVQFTYYEFELISADENLYTRKLSENIINSFQKRKETRFIKRQAELMAQKKEEEALLNSVTSFVDN